MKTVGIRELKENLSRYIQKVKLGERIVITERKKEVAVLLPLEMDSEEERMLKLVKKGTAFWSGAKPSGLRSRISNKGKSVSDAVIEDRR